MNIPTPEFLELSNDDTLWICRIAKSQGRNLSHDLPIWIEEHNRVNPNNQWIAPTVDDEFCIMSIPLPDGRGALGGDFLLIQGINGTNLLNTIGAPTRRQTAEVLASAAAFESFRLDRATFRGFETEQRELLEFQERAARGGQDILPSRALAPDFNREAFLEDLRTRRLDITVLDTEGLFFIHFPVWKKTDHEKKKSVCLDYIRAMALEEPDFQHLMLNTLIETALADPSKHGLRVYEYVDRFREKAGHNWTFDKFKGCSCEGRFPMIVQVPGGDDDCEACEMLFCYIDLNGVPHCQVISLKPYECP